MIVSRAPLRVSLFGGGTDFHNYFKNKNSKILTFTINKYIYVILKKRDDKLLYFNYSKKEILNNLNQAKHEIIREVLKKFKIYSGIEISILSDIPSKGSGLGSSSALTNALILACSRYKKIKLSQKQIAQMAIDVEINKLKKPIGIQDQYGTSIGGVKIIEMYKNKISIKKVKNKKLIKILNNNTIIFDTRKNRKAEEVLINQKRNITNNKEYLDKIRQISHDFLINLRNLNIKDFIDKLNLSWSIKKKLDKKITNSVIDQKINFLKNMNFEGFKLCGAGKGGFIFALSRSSIFKKKFDNINVKKISVDMNGTEIIYEKKL